MPVDRDASRSVAMTRYALYWAPEPDHALWAAGCAWLGRDPAAAPERDGTPWPDRHAPWRYGFHATLKPPFALRDGTDEPGLLAAARALASRTPCFAMPPLRLGWLRGFLALVPAGPLDEGHPLHTLADACVRELDAWRRPLAPEELARRLAESSLDAAQRDLAARWGSPHVLSHWTFHLTLTDPVPPRDAAPRADLQRQAAAHFAASLHAQPVPARSLCVFVEPRPGAPLRLTSRLPLAGQPPRGARPPHAPDTLSPA